MGRRSCWCAVLLLLAVAATPHARPIGYEDLEPLSNVVDLRGVWQALHLPQLPPTFCHVGLLGWHCHNSSMQPWNPQSLIPKEQMPPMPADASCIICPQGWKGLRKTLIDALLDWPIVRATGRLPRGSYYSMDKLKQAAAVVAAVGGRSASGGGTPGQSIVVDVPSPAAATAAGAAGTRKPQGG